MTAPQEDQVARPDPCPDHVWEVDGDLTRQQFDEIRDLLPAAIASGKEILVVKGVTLRRRDVRLPDSRVDIAEGRRLLAAATPGREWEVYEREPYEEDEPTGAYWLRGPEWIDLEDNGNWFNKADAELTAWLRNNADALLGGAGPDHPMDGYSYSGCDCSHCRGIRAEALLTGTPDLAPGKEPFENRP
jgi:hypothetical protein